ncbi:MAG: MarR family transcriptional regulator [Clostridiales bacterium]|jgi:DNA-binding MarR family transcriptional regulator|nr:MarR family transcriptional regulator [Clostridiales bacterium]
MEAGDQKLGNLYDLLFCAWPLLKHRLLPTGAEQAEFGMPLSHIEVLAMLDREGSLSVSQISRNFGIAKPNITPMVDHLIEEGLVMRERNSQDRRVVNVVICDEGRARLRRIYRRLCDRVFSWARTLSDEELSEFQGALRTIVRILGAEK